MNAILPSFKLDLTDAKEPRNHFIITYLVVWFIRNWYILFAVFNFEEECTLVDRLSFIQNYYQQNNFLEGIICNILWTIVAFVSGLILILLSKLILNYSNDKLVPIIDKLTEDERVVSRDKLTKAINERDKLQVILSESRDLFIKSEDNLLKEREKLFNKTKELGDKTTEIAKIRKQIGVAEEKAEKFKEKYEESVLEVEKVKFDLKIYEAYLIDITAPPNHYSMPSRPPEYYRYFPKCNSYERTTKIMYKDKFKALFSKGLLGEFRNLVYPVGGFKEGMPNLKTYMELKLIKHKYSGSIQENEYEYTNLGIQIKAIMKNFRKI